MWRDWQRLTFNDTIVFSLKTEGDELSLGEVAAFFQLLRKFMLDSLQNRILFRGVVPPVHSMLTHKPTRSWERLSATPQHGTPRRSGLESMPRRGTTLLLNALLERQQERKDWTMIDYEVPMKGGATIPLKAVNWPKALDVKELASAAIRRTPRAMAPSWLGGQSLPKGAERKCFNAVAFYDFVVKNLNLRPLGKKDRQRS